MPYRDQSTLYIVDDEANEVACSGYGCTRDNWSMVKSEGRHPVTTEYLFNARKQTLRLLIQVLRTSPNVMKPDVDSIG